jgi:hypothetical protein
LVSLTVVPTTTHPEVTDCEHGWSPNVIPSFITANCPIREARFVLNPNGTPDCGVHDLFSIQGRAGAPGCIFASNVLCLTITGDLL